MPDAGSYGYQHRLDRDPLYAPASTPPSRVTAAPSSEPRGTLTEGGVAAGDAAAVWDPAVSTTTAAALALSGSLIRVSWAATPGATSYIVQGRDVGGVFATIAQVPSSLLRLDDTGLAEVTAREYQVIPVRSGVQGVASAVVSATTLLNAPTGLTATLAANNKDVDLAWADASAAETGYEVQVDDGTGYTTLDAALAAGSIVYTDVAPAAGGRSYRVRALGATDSAWSAPASVEVAADVVSYQAAVLADGPELFWRLGEAAGAATAVDASGHGRDGTYTGAPTLGAASLLGSDADTAMQVDGGGQGAERLKEAWADGLASGAGAIELLFSVAAGDGFIAGFPSSFWIQASNGGLFLEGRNGDGTVIAGPSGTAAPGHLVVEWDWAAKRLSTYLNGALVGSGTLAGSGWAAITDALLTLEPAAAGVVDELAIYSHTLGAQRVYQHYLSAQQGAAPSGGPYWDALLALANLEVLWKCNEADGTSAADSSGNGRDGTYETNGVPGGPTLGEPSLMAGAIDTSVACNPNALAAGPAAGQHVKRPGEAWMGLTTFTAICTIKPISGYATFQFRRFMAVDGFWFVDEKWRSDLGALTWSLRVSNSGVPGGTDYTFPINQIAYGVLGVSYHVILTRTSAGSWKLRIYGSDGTSHTFGPVTQALPAYGTGALFLGGAHVDANDDFQGWVQGLALYSRVLSDAEIADLQAAWGGA